MDLLDRLLGHDSWTTRQLLDICASLTDKQLDRDFEIGHRTLRATLHHVIQNMEIWSSLMAGEQVTQQHDRSVTAMVERLTVASDRLVKVGRRIADRGAWDELWTDCLDDPPRDKTYGAGIAHVITHSMHHRAQLLYMLRSIGIMNLPEGDVFSWENQLDKF